MYCEIYGKGKPVLMIHGNGGSIRTFENSIEYFSKKYKVIAADSRAQGKSRDKGDSISFEMMADDEAALLDTLKIKKVYVIGWSDGGINALLLAIRHPALVNKLVSSGANLRPDSTALTISEWKKDNTIYEILKTKVVTTFADRNKKKLFMLDYFQPNIPNADLHKIKCPALIIGGDRDIITIEHTAMIYENIPRAYLWIVPDSGHRTIIEHNEEFNKKVDDFLSNNFHNK